MSPPPDINGYFSMGVQVPPTLDAATVIIVVRDHAARAPDLLMVERSSKLAFAPAAYVFPGGRVESTDHTFATRYDNVLPVDEVAARVAAIRETLEETGLAIGLKCASGNVPTAKMRQILAAGEPFPAVLERFNVSVDPHALIPFARWHPPAQERIPRAFDTRFYLTEAPSGQTASVDGTETVKLFWSSAEDVIARCDAGEGSIIFPTRRNLERLRLLESFSAMVAHSQAYGVTKIVPWIEDREGAPHLCIRGDAGYPVTSELVATALGNLRSLF